VWLHGAPTERAQSAHAAGGDVRGEQPSDSALSSSAASCHARPPPAAPRTSRTETRHQHTMERYDIYRLTSGFAGGGEAVRLRGPLPGRGWTDEATSPIEAPRPHQMPQPPVEIRAALSPR